jgi:hypothetical protein
MTASLQTFGCSPVTEIYFATRRPTFDIKEKCVRYFMSKRKASSPRQQLSRIVTA